jgi:tRNA A-37 threonylcarbamoyl transferase component Bud32
MHTPPAGLDKAVSEILAQPFRRVTRVTHDGRVFWIKRPERADTRMRLQKGNAQRNFDAERDALKTLCAAGLPFARIVMEGPDYFVTPDGGPPLMQVLQQAALPQAERVAAFDAAGRALARMHQAGFAHGRPSIKDICWKDGQITLLDLEYYSVAHDRFKYQVRDLILFLHSAFAAVEEQRPEITAAMHAYRAHDTTSVWAGAQRWCRRYRWLDPLTRPIQALKTRHVRDFRALPLLFDALKDSG